MQPHRVVSRDGVARRASEAAGAGEGLDGAAGPAQPANVVALPWVRVEKEYVFDAPKGEVTLADLFDGRSQLFLKHFMLGPGRRHAVRRLLVRGRPSRGHPRAPREPRSDATPSSRARRSRRSKPSAREWAGASPGSRPTAPTSTTTSTSPSRPRRSRPDAPTTTIATASPGLEDLSGDSVFVKDDAGEIFHTYSTFGRGGEEFLGAYATST